LWALFALLTRHGTGEDDSRHTTFTTTRPTGENTTMHTTDTQATDLDALHKLTAQLTALGFQATPRTPADGMPCLVVRNPRASVLAEMVYACDGSYWWSWREPIASTDQPQGAAAILARVLRAVGE
jgi:hypothetical protein